jgi:hypothetical protein
MQDARISCGRSRFLSLRICAPLCALLTLHPRLAPNSERNARWTSSAFSRSRSCTGVLPIFTSSHWRRRNWGGELAPTEFKLIFLPWHTHETYREDRIKAVQVDGDIHHMSFAIEQGARVRGPVWNLGRGVDYEECA